MKIALVAPSPVPFNVGGAEKLWWGLQRYINEETTHHCELIKVPVDESNIRGLLQAYRDFLNLKLDHFDMVISTKYPAWMVRHINHHTYLQHTLRGLYDTYNFSRLSSDVETSNSDIKDYLDKLESGDMTPAVILDGYDKLAEKYSDEPILAQFPGPFIKRVIHALDKAAMKHVKTFSCISNTVKNRTEYFPEGVVPDVMYHPSNLTGFRNGKSDYFFTISRLDNAKRIKMIVEAFKKAKTGRKLKIAGTGPMEEELKALAGADSRIEFLGFVSDRDVIDLYADALAAIFIPYDEDFGLITIEAMMSGKPVITFSDAGGVTEFVRDGETGLISEPTVDGLSANIDKAEAIFADGACAGACLDAVKEITWQSTAEHLIAKGVDDRKKIVVAATYPIYPPMGGGQLRVYNILKRVAESYAVHVVCFSSSDEPGSEEVCDGLYQHIIKYDERFRKEVKAIEKKLGISAADIGFMLHYDLFPEYIIKFSSLAKDADFVMAAQPYVYPMIRDYTDNTIIHDSQNVESYLKSQMVKEANYAEVKAVADIERETLQGADINIVCSEEDLVNFREMYATPELEATFVPNCIDTDIIYKRTKEEKAELKRKLGIESPVAIFVGSWHQPNIDAVYKIIEFAKELPDVRFMIIGSVGGYFTREKVAVPENIGITGMVSDGEKDLYLTIADVALNPMMSGSGTNLKMLEYMAAGIPVITTKTGARGLDVDESVAYICEMEKFCATLSNVCYTLDDNKTESARKHVEMNFSWGKAVRVFTDALKAVK